MLQEVTSNAMNRKSKRVFISYNVTVIEDPDYGTIVEYADGDEVTGAFGHLIQDLAKGLVQKLSPGKYRIVVEGRRKPHRTGSTLEFKFHVNRPHIVVGKDFSEWKQRSPDKPVRAGGLEDPAHVPDAGTDAP
jgi:hypothetical protein